MKSLSLADIQKKIEQKDDFSSLFGQGDFSLALSYISDFPNTKILREFIDMLCKYFHIPPKWRTRIILIVDELNNNAIEYGSKQGDMNIMYIDIQKRENNILDFSLRVQDAGTGEKAKKAYHMRELEKKYQDIDYLRHHSIRGRGLFLIISRLVDKIFFEDAETGGLRVGFSKRLCLDEC